MGRLDLRTGALLASMLCVAGSALALDPALHIDQYGHDVWTTQNGLPGEAVYQILQSPDGYLWLRTSAGLVRFDGVRFVRVEPVAGGRAITEPVKAICLGAGGDLLVRSITHTLIYRDGAFRDYRPPAALPDGDIRVLFESRAGRVFIGSDDFLYSIPNDGAPQTIRQHTGWINGMLEDDKGAIWVADATALLVYKDGRLSKFSRNLYSSSALAQDGDHLWVGALNGLYSFARPNPSSQPVAPQAIHGEVNALLKDHDGNLWAGTTAAGLIRLAAGAASSFTTADRLSDDRVLSLYEDPEGSLWVGTAAGLDRFRKTKLTTFTGKEGLPADRTAMAVEARDGSVYVLCLGGGLARIKNGAVTALTAKDGMPELYGNGMLESRDGSLWLGNAGLIRYRDGKFTRYSGERFAHHWVSAIGEDEEGLIVATDETLVLRFRDGVIRPFTIRGQMTPLSTPGNYTFTIYRDPSGTLWFGTVKGLFKFAKGESPARSRQKQIDFPVSSIFDDGRGSLWLGGRFPGLVRFDVRGGRVTHYTKRDGLFDSYTTRALPDDDGNLWISTADGIYMAPRGDLDGFRGGRISAVRAMRFDTADGMKTSEASSPFTQPAGWRTRDGKLWFTTQKGIVVVDPRHLRHNNRIPPVVIEEVVADGTWLSPIQDLHIPAGKDKVEFHYTGLSLPVPSRVRFRVQLEGYDRGWVDADARRVAYYTNLPPGRYRFRAIAANDDGVWNLEGASLTFVLLPHFYQSGWFRAALGVAFLLAALAGQRLYTRRLRARAAELARVVGERTRDLQAQKKFLQQVIDITPNHIFVKDLEGRFTLVNRTLAEVHSLRAVDLIGKTAAEVVPDADDAKSLRNEDLEVMRTSREQFLAEAKLTTATGQVRWLQLVKCPLFNENGKVTHVLGVGTDITQLRAAKEAAEGASRAKSEFLANMSHEIRTPMNGILGMTELALDTDLTAEQREYLDMVRSSAEALLAVIGDVLDFSKIEAGKLDLDPVPFGLRAHLAHCVRPLAMRADQKGLELTCEIDPGVPDEVVADAGRLRQIVINLVGNAVKFTESGEVGLAVDVESRGPERAVLHFTIRDTGIGIAPEKQATIFEAFSQGDSSMTRKFGGTGLGLTISARLAGMMGGRIWLESQPGQGSCFHFTAPVGLAPGGAGREPAEQVQLAGLRALVVDDNATNRRILGTVLERWGMLPVLASSAAEAMDLLRPEDASAGPFALILVDAQMPGQDGFALVEWLLKQADLGHTTMMMLSSAAQSGDAARCRELGIAAYLTKPVMQAQLWDAVRAALGTQAAPVKPFPAGPADPAGPPARPGTPGLRVLLAEDNAVNQKLASRLLERRGHTVAVAGNGRQALEMLDAQEFDLVVMDVSMPEMDGFEAAAAIRAREVSTGAHIPILAITAHAMKGDRERCLAAGMDGYVAKPVQAAQLFAAIDSVAAARL
jgi:PAS domain S-box-containing protein